MLKIVMCNDPVFSIREHPGKIEWSGLTREAVLEKLFNAVKSNKPAALAYAEHLFSDEVSALAFFELISKTDSDVTFFCKEMDLPAVLTRYAVIEPEKLELTIFAGKIKALPFSDNGKKTIFENFKGFPFSRIDGIIEE
ncbi:MAG TPA: hypothetical protein P5044_06790, partial [bacterium]|nr:hypothetical protein [bacterium]